MDYLQKTNKLCYKLLGLALWLNFGILSMSIFALSFVFQVSSLQPIPPRGLVELDYIATRDEIVIETRQFSL